VGERLLAKVLAVSDPAVASLVGESADAVAKRLAEAGFEVVERVVIREGKERVAAALTRVCFGFKGLVVTTGGSGFGPRDFTPEGTAEVLDRQAPGLAELMRRAGPAACLHRGVAGILGKALVCNLPDTPEIALAALDAIIDLLPAAFAALSDPAPEAPRGGDA
jgi:molybdopterin adenylyltransferase